MATFYDAAEVTTVYTSSLTAQPQGGTMDDDGNVYTCFYSAGKFSIYNLKTQTETTKTFTANAYGHANGMAYNPNTGHLYIAAMKDTGEVYELTTGCELVATLYAKKADDTPINCWNIAYDRKAGRFVFLGGGTIYFYDDAFELIDTGTYETTDWPNTRQDIETDGNYIYCVSYNGNKITVLNMDGEKVATINNAAFSGEPESLIYDWNTKRYYMEGKSGKYVIRSEVFKKGEKKMTYPTTLSATDATAPTLSAATRADEEEGYPLTLSEATEKEVI